MKTRESKSEKASRVSEIASNLTSAIDLYKEKVLKLVVYSDLCIRDITI